MLELAHLIGLNSLTQKSKKQVNVKLILSNADLLSYYKELYTEKQALADQRIVFEWQSLATFLKEL